MAESRDLQARGKQELTTAAEQTKSGLVFTPAVDIFETDNEITLLADMAGVRSDKISIDLREGVLTVTGEEAPWEESEESDVLVEFEIGKYYRQFTLSEFIDQAKIEAKLQDGVLRLVMPKVKRAMPHRIEVTVS